VTQLEHGRRNGSFVRGLTLGAILGAIIAGSSVWSRRRRRQRTQPTETTAID
jgi:hypothetical protein